MLIALIYTAGNYTALDSLNNILGTLQFCTALDDHKA